MVTCLAAAVLSVRLLPPAPRRLRALPMLALLAHFIRGSVLGGLDVAVRALHPRLPVQPGWILHPSGLPAGPQRMLLGDILSLMPGSLAAGDQRGAMLVHCLDTRQPVGEDVEQLERRVRAVLGEDDG